jgi:hypothetical protein
MAEVSEPAAISSRDRPSRWWHWILLYPTLLITIISAVPTWLHEFKVLYLAVTQDISRENVPAVQTNTAFWNKEGNKSCLVAPHPTTGGASAMAVVCPTGDVAIRIRDTGGLEYYAAAVLREDLIPVPAQPYAGAAYAQEPGQAQPGEVPTYVVSSQMKPDGRTLVRIIRHGQDCVEEEVDTFTGAVLGVRPVECP